MSTAVRWENAQLRIFQDGADIGTLFATEFSDDEEFQDDKSKYQGSEIPDGDATYMGGSLSMTLELQNGSVNIDNMIDRYRDGVKQRTDRGKLTVLASKRYANGTVVAYRYSNCRLMPSERGSQNQRHTKTLRCMFDNKERVQ